jgi:release factor glutamine methyltransferase
VANLNWTIIALINELTKLFTDKSVPSPRLSAEMLILSILNLSRVQLYLQQDRPLTEPELQQLRDFTRRRIKHEPLQYITGTANFRNLQLIVNPSVLIPRPETEQLVDLVLKEIKDSDDILEIGTGSGCLAISLVTEHLAIQLVTIEISKQAIEVANLNITKYAVADRIKVILGDVREIKSFVSPSYFNIIVSNPPYIPETQRNRLPKEVIDFEPAIALLAGDDGLEVIRSLFDIGDYCLKPGGILIFEFGDKQIAEIEKIAQGSDWLDSYCFYNDLNQIPRFFFGRKRI